MIIKLLEFIASIASLVSLFITVSQWEASNIYSRLLFLIAFVTTGLLAYLLYEYSQLLYENSRLRSSVIPQLIHLKGACAVSHELSLITNTLTKDELNDNSVHKVLTTLANNTKKRIEDISSNDEKLKEAMRLTSPANFSDKFGKPNNDEALKLLQSDMERAHEIVNNVDRNKLRQEKLENFVYHITNNQ
ncbi:MAG: hypothetical protein WA102_14140 [Candidatus Methanoperedens sp.]